MGCSQSTELPVKTTQAPRAQTPEAPTRTTLTVTTTATTMPTTTTATAAAAARHHVQLSATESVLTSPPLFLHVVSFMDGLPGLLREIKGSKDASDDIATAVVKHERKQRALEMISHDGRPFDRTAAAVAAIDLHDVTTLRWLVAHSADPTTEFNLASLWRCAIDVHTTERHTLPMMATLLEIFPLAQTQSLPKKTWHAVASYELATWIAHNVQGAKLPYEELFTNAIDTNDTALIDFVLEHRPEQAGEYALSQTLGQQQWPQFLYLASHAKYMAGNADKQNMIERAAASGDLALLKSLLRVPLPTPPVKALESAAKQGFFEIFYEIVMRDTTIPMASSLVLAASNGHIGIVQFILQHNTTATLDLSDATDGAAGNGHVDIVRLLCASPFARFSTNAMDAAATNGHLEVVQFLTTQRSEGCTHAALSGAAAGHHDGVVRFLLTHHHVRKDQWSQGLDALLLHGYVDEWLTHRSLQEDDDNTAALQHVMREAGAKGKASVIRYIYETLGHHQLKSFAIEGAATLGSVAWLNAVHTICGGGGGGAIANCSDTQSAVEAAIDIEYNTLNIMTTAEERVDAIKWLLLHHPSADLDRAIARAIEYATAKKHQLNHRTAQSPVIFFAVNHGHPKTRLEQIATGLAEWRDTRRVTRTNTTTQQEQQLQQEMEMDEIRRKYDTRAFRFLAHGRVCDWVIEVALQQFVKSYATWEQRQQTKGQAPYQPWKYLGADSYPKQAIRRNDVAVLQLLYEESLTNTDVFVREEDDDEEKEDEFAFDAYYLVRCAIASGNVDTVRWCIDTFYSGGSGVDFSLLNAAITYAQPRVADWLLAHYSHSIVASIDDSKFKFQVYGEYAKTREVFDWLNNLRVAYPPLQKYLRPDAVARSAVGFSPNDIVCAWVERHPQAVADLDELLSFAALSRNLRAVEMVYGLVVKYGATAWLVDQKGRVANNLQMAMATAASNNQLEMVRFLFDKFPGVNWYAAVEDAARYGHVRVLWFFFMHGYASRAQSKEFTHHRDREIRTLCFLCGKV